MGGHIAPDAVKLRGIFVSCARGKDRLTVSVRSRSPQLGTESNRVKVRCSPHTASLEMVSSRTFLCIESQPPAKITASDSINPSVLVSLEVTLTCFCQKAYDMVDLVPNTRLNVELAESDYSQQKFEYRDLTFK